MQRVSAFLPSWDKRSSSGTAKPGTAKTGSLFGWGSRSVSGPPAPKSLAAINIAKANGDGRLKREAFWPATLDQECDKAARILKAFCGASSFQPL